MSNLILSKKVLRDTFYQLNIAKSQLSKLDYDHYIISKYHKCWWYQQGLQATEQELWAKALKLVPLIEQLQQIVSELEWQLSQHFEAMHFQKNSMKPFDGIKLNEHTLLQQTLF
jgi:hypothetical protein